MRKIIPLRAIIDGNRRQGKDPMLYSWKLGMAYETGKLMFLRMDYV